MNCRAFFPSPTQGGQSEEPTLKRSELRGCGCLCRSERADCTLHQAPHREDPHQEAGEAGMITPPTTPAPMGVGMAPTHLGSWVHPFSRESNSLSRVLRGEALYATPGQHCRAHGELGQAGVSSPQGLRVGDAEAVWR